MRLIYLLPLLIVGCTVRAPELKPPNLSIVELTFSETEASAAVRIDNVAEVALPIGSIQFDLTFDDQRHSLTPDFAGRIPILGSETLTLTFDPKVTPKKQFEYFIDGSVVTEDGEELAFERTGRLYPTPGRPGSFR